MSRDPRQPFAFALVVASILATGAYAADGDRGRRVRTAMPATATLHHSGGYVPLPPGDVLVGSIERAASNPSSWNPFGTVGYYDDGPHCVIRQIDVAFLFEPHFRRTCRAVE